MVRLLVVDNLITHKSSGLNKFSITFSIKQHNCCKDVKGANAYVTDNIFSLDLNILDIFSLKSLYMYNNLGNFCNKKKVSLKC